MIWSKLCWIRVSFSIIVCNSATFSAFLSRRPPNFCRFRDLEMFSHFLVSRLHDSTYQYFLELIENAIQFSETCTFPDKFNSRIFPPTDSTERNWNSPRYKLKLNNSSTRYREWKYQRCESELSFSGEESEIFSVIFFSFTAAMTLNRRGKEKTTREFPLFFSWENWNTSWRERTEQKEAEIFAENIFSALS